MRRFPNFILSIIILFPFTGLQSCVPSTPRETGITDDFIANIYLRYDAEVGSLKSEIRFIKDSSSTESVKFDKLLSINGKSLHINKSPTSDVFYKLESKSLATGPFVFTIGDSEIPVILPLVDSIHFEKPLSATESNRLSWAGMPLQKSETLVILIEDHTGTVHSFHRLGPSSYSSTLLHKEQLARVKPGKGKLSIVRKNSLAIPEGLHAAGTILAEFYAKSIEMQILP